MDENKMRKKLLEKLGMQYDEKSDIPVHERFVEGDEIKQGKDIPVHEKYTEEKPIKRAKKTKEHDH